jgi:hypothetical protein
MLLCLILLVSLSTAPTSVVGFIAAPTYTSIPGQLIGTGDFNGDGILDLVLVNAGTTSDYSDSAVSIIFGNGDGSFHSSGVSSIVGGFLPAGAIGDFNGDGHLDVVVANYRSGGTASVLLGNSDGTFQAAQNTTIATGAAPYLAVGGMAVGDFNGDGHLDLAVTNGGLDMVSILLGNGDGTFQAALNYTVPASPDSVAIGDFNHDGILDLAVASRGRKSDLSDSNVTVLLGNGDGTFQPPQSYAASKGATTIVVADFNGEGILDLATIGNPSETLSVLLGNGDGTFQAAQNYYVAPAWGSLVVGDFNGDGLPDLAASGNTGTVILLNSP